MTSVSNAIYRLQTCCMCGYLSGVDGTGREGIQRRHVCVLPFHRLLCGRAVVDAAHHLGAHQRTFRRMRKQKMNPFIFFLYCTSLKI